MNKQIPKNIAVLDACVLYPAPVRNLLLYAANEFLFQPKWSNIIQDEWIKNLLINRPDLDEQRLKNTATAMDNAFADAAVFDFEDLIPTINLPDENDRHVLAAAIKAKANIIVTFNLKDFPQQELNKHHIEVLHPDDFLCKLHEMFPHFMEVAFYKQITALKNPPIPKDEMIQHLIKCDLKKIAAKLSS